jgi:hypothetical protein
MLGPPGPEPAGRAGGSELAWGAAHRGWQQQQEGDSGPPQALCSRCVPGTGEGLWSEPAALSEWVAWPSRAGKEWFGPGCSGSQSDYTEQLPQVLPTCSTSEVTWPSPFGPQLLTLLCELPRALNLQPEARGPLRSSGTSSCIRTDVLEKCHKASFPLPNGSSVTNEQPKFSLGNS